MQSIYIYSDESGVFDKYHNDIFIYGGIVCIGQDISSILSRKYLLAEKSLRKSPKYKNKAELKASMLDNSDKRKLYRVIEDCYKFIVAVDLPKLKNERFESRYSKQRYLDYAYKRGLKGILEKMNSDHVIRLEEEIELKCYVDEQNTSTNGRYSLEETIYNEFKYGVYSGGFDFKPIARKLETVDIKYCNSETTTLVRSADIFANRVLFEARNTVLEEMLDSHTYLIRLP